MNCIDKFKLPIQYLKGCNILSDNVREDLELIPTDNSEETLYHKLFDASDRDPYSDLCIQHWNKYYCTNKEFLRDTQKIIGKISDCLDKCVDDDMLLLYKNILSETAFMEKYVSYMEWNRMIHLNTNELFLNLSGIYHIISPLLSIMIPITIFIIPFIILKLANIPLTFETYIDNLRATISSRGMSMGGGSDTNMYLIVTLVIYFIQIYQNVMACFKFRRTLETVQKETNILYIFLSHTSERMKKFETSFSDIDTYNGFIEDMIFHRNVIESLKLELRLIKSIDSDTLSVYDVLDIGKKLKHFYALYNDGVIMESISYSIYFNGYINNMLTLSDKKNEHKISMCKFTKGNTKYKGGYFIGVTSDSITKNKLGLSKNVVITGPNASGKTTIMKGTMFNNILSQQIGCGCYKGAHIRMYDNFHSYMNIPDTSGRDSLFQAEARRCKEIIKSIKETSGSHMCIFDELYSGTNPSEAISSAMAFVHYINKIPNTRFILTTHYTEICEYIDKLEGIKNYHMEVNDDDSLLKFSYKISDGFSTMPGGINVLKMLDYPDEIIKDVMKHSS